jgi:hypothetical protein
MHACRNLYLALSLLLIAVVASAGQAKPAAEPQRTVIHAGHVLDVHTGVSAANQASPRSPATRRSIYGA